jgi:TetR/AcrR family tetracycline transcriptional repressor
MRNPWKNRLQPARSRGTSAGIDRAQIVSEAIGLLQREGLAGVSTRRVAERLGVKSPALYWHVHDKDELLQLVADALCAEMVLPQREQSFRKRLEKIASEYRRVLVAHRDAPRLFAELPPVGPHRMKLYDAAVETFLDAGFPNAEAVAMATFYRHYLLGMITEEARGRRAGETPGLFPASALGVELQHIGGGTHDYPSLSGAAKLLTRIQPEKLFKTGLNVILDGLELRASVLRRKRARSR